MMNVALNGPDDLSITGKIHHGGHVELYDTKGGYYYGSMEPDCTITFYGPNNSYFYGIVDPNGNVVIHGPRGLNLLGRIV